METPKSKVYFSWKPVLDKKKIKNANRFYISQKCKMTAKKNANHPKNDKMQNKLS